MVDLMGVDKAYVGQSDDEAQALADAIVRAADFWRFVLLVLWCPVLETRHLFVPCRVESGFRQWGLYLGEIIRCHAFLQKGFVSFRGIKGDGRPRRKPCIRLLQ